ncbi:hypothetical protein FQZ97_1144240 [compost metagenome]
MVWKGSTMLPGEAVAPACMLGHTAVKSGQISAFSMLPSAGTECTRAHHRAVKKAPKNITSEKMNQLMLQRKDRSILRPYRPLSLSPTDWLNHWNRTISQKARPKASEYAPQPAPLTHWPAPRMTKNSPMAAITGCREGPGTK